MVLCPALWRCSLQPGPRIQVASFHGAAGRRYKSRHWITGRGTTRMFHHAADHNTQMGSGAGQSTCLIKACASRWSRAEEIRRPGPRRTSCLSRLHPALSARALHRIGSDSRWHPSDGCTLRRRSYLTCGAGSSMHVVRGARRSIRVRVRVRMRVRVRASSLLGRRTTRSLDMHPTHISSVT